MLEKLKSRKFWITIGANFVVLVLLTLGLITADKAAELVALVGGSYVVGQGVVDALAAKK